MNLDNVDADTQELIESYVLVSMMLDRGTIDNNEANRAVLVRTRNKIRERLSQVTQIERARVDLEVTISGEIGSGKSVLMGDVARHLQSLGYTVTCFEEDRSDKSQSRPVDPSELRLTEWIGREPRNVHIQTKQI